MTDGKPPAGNTTSRDATGRHLVYFAAERTLLSWIRTALGLMALGFVIDRFGLVLSGMLLQGQGISRSPGFSFWAGAGLVVTGALMAAVATVRYFRFALRYHRDGDTEPGHGLFPTLIFTAMVAVAGAVIAWFLSGMAPWSGL